MRNARRQGERASEGDVLEWLADTATPTFATDDEQRIVFWNRGAEELFGCDPAEAVGTACYEIVRGRDGFGNRFCYRDCPVMATHRWGEPVTGCEFHAPTDDGHTAVSVTLLQLPGRGRASGHLVHILRPAAANGLQREAVASSEASGSGRGAAIQRAGSNGGAGNGHGNGNGRGNGHGNGHDFVDEAVEPPLTTREIEILHWVAAGLPNKDVAQQLGISLATVRNHIHSILEKLDVHSKLEAVSLAFRRGWVSGQPEEEEALIEA